MSFFEVPSKLVGDDKVKITYEKTVKMEKCEGKQQKRNQRNWKKMNEPHVLCLQYPENSSQNLCVRSSER